MDRSRRPSMRSQIKVHPSSWEIFFLRSFMRNGSWAGFFFAPTVSFLSQSLPQPPSRRYKTFSPFFFSRTFRQAISAKELSVPLSPVTSLWLGPWLTVIGLLLVESPYKRSSVLFTSDRAFFPITSELVPPLLLNSFFCFRDFFSALSLESPADRCWVCSSLCLFFFL